MDKISYALGLSLGNNLLSSGIKSLNIEKTRPRHSGCFGAKKARNNLSGSPGNN